MANYLNGAFRGLALGMQFMQNQDQLAAEKSMQVERIRANQTLQDDRIAANATEAEAARKQRGEHFSIENKNKVRLIDLEENRINHNIAMGVADSDRADRRLDSNIAVQDSNIRNNNLQTDQGILESKQNIETAQSNNKISQNESRVNVAIGEANVAGATQQQEMELATQNQAGDAKIGAWLANRVASKHGSDPDLAARDKDTMNGFVAQLNLPYNSSRDQYANRDMTDQRWELVGGENGEPYDVVLSGTNSKGQRTLLTANGRAARDYDDPAVGNAGGDAILAALAVGEAAGVPSSAALENYQGGGKGSLSNRVGSWLGEIGIDADQVPVMDVGSFSQVGVAKSEDYDGPPMTVLGREVAPVEVDPSTPEGKQLAQLNKQKAALLGGDLSGLYRQGSPEYNKVQRLRLEIEGHENDAIEAAPPLYVDQDGALREPTNAQRRQRRLGGLFSGPDASAAAGGNSFRGQLTGQQQAAQTAGVVDGKRAELASLMGGDLQGINAQIGEIQTAARASQVAQPPAPPAPPAAAPVLGGGEGPLRSQATPPPPRSIGYDSPDLRRALGTATLGGTPEQTMRGADGMQVVPITPTELRQQLTQQNRHPLTGLKNPDPNSQPIGMAGPVSDALTATFMNTQVPNYQLPDEGDKDFTSRRKTTAKNWPEIQQEMQTPRFMEGLQANFPNMFPQDISQWSEAHRTAAIDFAYSTIPLATK
jgi:hypothetical protein